MPVIDLVNELSKKFTVFFIPHILSRSKPEGLNDYVVYCPNAAIHNINPDVVFSTYSNLLACAYLKVKTKSPIVNYMFIYTTIKDILSTKFLAFPTSYKMSELLKSCTYFLPKSWIMPEKLIVPNLVVWQEMVRFGFDKEKIVIMPWGINLGRYEKYYRNALKTNDKVILAYAGPSHPLRFSVSLLRSFYELRKQHKDLYFLLLFRKDLWHQPTYHQLVNFIKRFNLERSVILKVGLTHDDFLRYISTTTIVILPYFSSGIVEMPPFTLLECMLLSKTVITNSGVATYGIIESGVNGFTIPEASSSLIDLLDFLVDNKRKANHIGQRARAFIRENYNLANFSRRLSHLFKIADQNNVRRL